MFSKFDNTTPGCSVIAFNDKKIMYTNNIGLADMENKIPIGSNTSFRLASLTKTFTAMAIMILDEMKLLKFDDPIIKFFPDFPKYGKKITISQLLSHTSGLPDHEKPLYDEIDTYGEPTIYDSFEILKKQKSLLFRYGTKFEYSNSGFVLLALIIEKVAGEKYSSFLQKNIFAPLGLKNTIVVDETKPFINNRAFGYKKEKNKYIDYDYDPLNYIIGDEGIYSTVLDLVQWIRAWQYPILVKKETLNMSLRLQKLEKGKFGRCGFSWFIQNIYSKKYIFHDGFWVGFNNIMLTECETNITVIILSNTNEFSTEKKRIDAALEILNSLRF